MLITSGTGAGTPDKVNPFNPVRHFWEDYVPFVACGKGGMMDKYWEVRPPNKGKDPNGEPCPDNPTKLKKDGAVK
ncbi:MAG: hypothetical protein R3C53_19325 [Pirellulaceae bacterium]